MADVIRQPPPLQLPGLEAAKAGPMLARSHSCDAEIPHAHGARAAELHDLAPVFGWGVVKEIWVGRRNLSDKAIQHLNHALGCLGGGDYARYGACLVLLNCHLVPHHKLYSRPGLPRHSHGIELLQHRHTAVAKVVYVCLEGDHDTVAEGVCDFGVVAKPLIAVRVDKHLPCILTLLQRLAQRLRHLHPLLLRVRRLRAAPPGAQVHVLGHLPIERGALDDTLLEVDLRRLAAALCTEHSPDDGGEGVGDAAVVLRVRRAGGRGEHKEPGSGRERRHCLHRLLAGGLLVAAEEQLGKVSTQRGVEHQDLLILVPGRILPRRVEQNRRFATPSLVVAEDVRGREYRLAVQRMARK
mmetsp:Transcript_22514/g.43696  ORF Transcript_22514/g.43696 Transcript_22514/m.43696 type:complete len:354 (+) Transcript_22514:27-1088(+)